MREVYPIKSYKDEDFVEYKIEIGDADLADIIEEYLMRHADFEFDEIEIVNNRPMNIWLHAKCRRYIDPDENEDEQVQDAEAKSRHYNGSYGRWRISYLCLIRPERG